MALIHKTCCYPVGNRYVQKQWRFPYFFNRIQNLLSSYTKMFCRFMKKKRKFNTVFLISQKSAEAVQTEYDLDQVHSHWQSTFVILILKVFGLGGHMSMRGTSGPGRKKVHFRVCMCVCVCVCGGWGRVSGSRSHITFSSVTTWYNNLQSHLRFDVG